MGVIEAEVVVEHVVDNVEEAEGCIDGVLNDVSDPETVEHMLCNGLGDGAEELEGDNETELVVELVVDIVEEAEGCIDDVLNDVSDPETVEHMLCNGLDDIVVVLEEVVECVRLLETEVVVEPDVDIVEEDEGCIDDVLNDVSDPETVEHMLCNGLDDIVVVLEEVIECIRLFEPEVDVEPDVDIVEEDEDCRVGVLNDVDDTEVVELMLIDGLGDGPGELEPEVDVEPVVDIVEEAEGCRVGVLNDVDDTEVVELMLVDGLGDGIGEFEPEVDVEPDVDIVEEAEC